MIRKVFLPLVLFLLAIALWYSPEFEEIAAGVAILLFGMIALENGFKTFAEGPLKSLLKKATDKLYKSMGLGMITTALLQSSSLISVIAISFISAGLLNLVGGIGIIFGANIGTTATAWLVAIFGLNVKISAFALPLLVFGIILLFQKKAVLKGIGNILAGLGFLFLGIYFMKEGFDTYQDVIRLDEYAMSGITGLIVFVGLGILATVVLQSSSATIAIILTALAAGQITYFNALALAIGANVGTTITAIIGSTASNASGKQLAGAHLIFNVITALVAIIFLQQLNWAVEEISEILGFASTNYTFKLALFHTVFNVLGVVIMYPFVKHLANFLTKYIKDSEILDIDQPKFLAESALLYPQSAIGAMVQETQHLFNNAFEVISHSIGLNRSDIKSKMKLKEVVKGKGYEKPINIDDIYLKKIKTIYGKIIEFATLTQQMQLSPHEVTMIYNIREANRSFVKVVKDLKDLQPNMTRYLQTGSLEMKREYDKFRIQIIRIVRDILTIQSFQIDEGETASKHLDKKELAHQIDVQRKKFEKQRQKIIENDVLVNGKIDELIRNDVINSEMASSLINDSGTVARISKNLIKAAELLYLNSDFPLIDGNASVNNSSDLHGVIDVEV